MITPERVSALAGRYITADGLILRVTHVNTEMSPSWELDGKWVFDIQVDLAGEDDRSQAPVTERALAQFTERLKAYDKMGMRAAAFRGLAESIVEGDYSPTETVSRLQALCAAANEADRFWNERGTRPR